MKPLALAALLLFAPCLSAQVEVSTGEPSALSGDDIPEWARKLAIDPESEGARAYASAQKKRIDVERDLKKIRMMHFRNTKSQSKRQEGIVKLYDFTDPALDPSLIEIFAKEKPDVRTAILDMFADRRAESGDTSLAWVAVFDDEPEIRMAAADRLRRRMSEEGGSLTDAARLVVYEGLRSGNPKSKAAAADLANLLGIVEAIPWMIASQVSGAAVGGGAGTGRKGDLAWIAVGTQQAFVSDLTPVVGPFAVAFDPELSVVTSGTLLRINDAVVIEYHLDIHNALIDMSSRLSESDTRPLGWNLPAWRDWYAKDFLPMWAKKAEAEKQASEAAAVNSPATAPRPGANPAAPGPQ